MECNRDCIICGSVGAVCELEWVWGFWDDGVDVSHDQPFNALHGYRRECYWAVVILAGYLRILGHRDYGGLLETSRFTDSVRERLKISVKALASWSAHVLSTLPVNQSGPQPCEC